MVNPLRSEEDAFRFTLIVAALLAPIAIVAIVFCTGVALGVAGGLALGLVVGLFVLQARRAARRRCARPQARRRGDDAHRILVVANETLCGRGAAERDRAARATGDARRCGSWSRRSTARSSTGRTRRTTRAQQAGAGSSSCSADLRAEGLRRATGDIGDDDPVQAMEDALRRLPGRRGDHLDAPAGPLELARARRRAARPRPLRRSASPTWSSISTARA